MSVPHGDLLFGFRVEAVGTSAGQTYFCVGRLPAYIPAPIIPAIARWRPVIVDGIPNVQTSVDFFTGGWTVGSMSLRLRAAPDVFTTFTNHIKPVSIDELASAINATTTTISFDGGTPATVAENDPIWIARECIILGPESPPASGTFINCTRGAFETEATEHDSAKFQDIAIYDRMINPQGRRVTVGYLTEEKSKDSTASDADFQVHWAGIVDDIGSADSWNTVVLKLLGIGAISAETQLYPRRWRGVVLTDASAIGEEEAFQHFVVQKVPRGQTTPDFPLNMGTSPSIGDTTWVRFGNSACVLEYRGNTADEGPLYKLRLDLTLRFMPPISPTDVKAGDECWEILTSDPKSKTDGPIGFNILPLGNSRNGNYGDVLTILLQVLTTTSTGLNGAYDLGIRSLGPGIPSSQIDVAGIESLRGELVGRSSYKSLYIGINSEPDNLMQWIQNILLAPFSLVMAQNNQGVWTVKYLRDLPPTPPRVLTDASLFQGSSIRYSSQIPRQSDTVEFRYQMDAKGEPKILDFINESAKERRLNAAGPVRIDALGLDDDFQANDIAQVHVFRRRAIVPEVEFTTKLNENLKAGDPVSFTSSQMIDVDNTGQASLGTTEQLCYITAATPMTKGKDARTDYKAMVWGLSVGNVGRIGNALEVVAGFVYDDIGAPGVVEFTPTEFQSPTPDFAFTKDVEAFVKFDILRQCDQFGEEINGLIEVGTVDLANSKIEFSSYPASWDAGSPPLAGEIFQDDGWDVIVERQEQFVHRAKSNGKLGIADDDGFNWAR